MAKSTDLVIKDWTKGIGPSPHLGFGDMRNVDVYDIPGIARLNYALVKASGTTVTDLILWQVQDPLVPGRVWALGDTGKLYKSTDSGASWTHISGNTSGGVGQGLAVWNNYVFTFRATAIDLYDIGASAWRNSWKTDLPSDSLWHPAYVSKNDGNLYIGAGRYVSSVEEIGTFDYNNAGTYTWTPQALDLPENYRIKCLAELGNNLEIGTWMGSSITDYMVADLFPWDRSSPSFGEPLQFHENGINQMIGENNTLYIQAGTTGKYFVSNGVQKNQIAQIPYSIADLESGLNIECFPGAMVWNKERIYSGLSAFSGNSGLPCMGVWSINPNSTSNTLVMENTISSGADGTSTVVRIGSILNITPHNVLVGWLDGSTYGIDKTDSNHYGSYLGYVVSPFYNVGTPLLKRQFTQGEFELAKPLISGEGVKVSYRTNLSASFTLIGTYDFSTLAGVISHNFIPDIPDCEFVQIKVALTSSGTSTPYLRTVTLR